jgi:Ca2+-binding EF-hand superfamily protein
MNKPLLLILAAGFVMLASPAVVNAAKDPDKKAAKQAIKAVLAEYDKNGNGVIDGDEKDAVRKAYEADKNGPLKRFDVNNDGTLDDSELAAIHKKQKGKKKSA